VVRQQQQLAVPSYAAHHHRDNTSEGVVSEQFTPASPDPVNPDDALADLEADFQASTTPPEVAVIEEEPPPVGRSWSFDFPRQQFLLGHGGHSPLETNGIGTLVQWAEKCLRTARGAHPIHPPGYGLQNPHALLGGVIDGAPVAELEAQIREALTFHPRIADIDDFDYDFDPTDEWVSITFTMVLDDDTRLPANTTLTPTLTTEF
jgi:hypothetical protein